MEDVQNLSTDQCVLTAVDLASQSDITGLKALLKVRADVVTYETLLQILLTYLPESCKPSQYSSIIAENETPESTSEGVRDLTFDFSQLTATPNGKAKSQRKKLHLQALEHPSCPPNEDLLSRFLVCRTHKLADAGLLQLVPELVGPFLDDREFLKTWFIGNVLPLLRYNFEYYPDETRQIELQSVEGASGDRAADMWLEHSITEDKSTSDEEDEPSNNIARDLRGLLGPWMYGGSQRKRRKLSSRPRASSVAIAHAQEFKRLELDGAELPDDSHGWEHALTWIARKAADDLPAISVALDQWDGPKDVDFGGYTDKTYLTPQMDSLLHVRYAQTAFAAVYAAASDSMQTVSSAHSVLVRIAMLMEFVPPPDLATSVDMLPKIDAGKSVLEDLPKSVLDPDVLLKSGHPLTTPTTETFALLQMFVYSAYILAELGYPLSIVKSALTRFQATKEEQNAVFHKMIHMAAMGARKDEQQLRSVRSKLLWLWGWGISDNRTDGSCFGYGIIGKIERSHLEKDILKMFLVEQHYNLAVATYLDGPNMDHGLSKDEIEECIIMVGLNHYDNASNGNRTRGSIKKASEMIRTLKKHFPDSMAFRRFEALLSATHALSFYSLILQYGVPFQPVSIRVSSEPLSLIEKVLAQNSKSYTHLDDLISIGVNLVKAGLTSPYANNFLAKDFSTARFNRSLPKVERRVIGMAIESALQDDDFETAYSYVVNRLATSEPTLLPSESTIATDEDVDDISWRAALAAGRHKSSVRQSLTSTSLSTPPALRRLEQRMELLSQALLLAPPASLPEVLNVWRKCEEEMSALVARETAEEEAFDDAAERGLPGAFVSSAPIVQPRREVGRGGQEEEPLGLFDVAKGAARAFSKSAFPLRAGAAGNRSISNVTVAPASSVRPTQNSGYASHSRTASDGGSDSGSEKGGNQRKRDMIANAASGALASGLGWMLGATPVQQQPQNRH